MTLVTSSRQAAVLPSDKLIDGELLRADVLGLAGNRGELTQPARAAIVVRLKRALAEGRAEAERRLRQDGHGTFCAGRLSNLQDTLIRVIHDFATEHAYLRPNPTASEKMAIVAVGGYGRSTLAPGSDIDLLFLLPYKQTPWGESVVEFVLYLLWDLGLKVGHATRSVTECIRLSRSDMTIRTAVLEARYICGERALFDELETRFDKEVVKGSGPEFIAAKLAERDARHRSQGASRYLVEPNVKDGKGGLRDLQTLFWIAKYFYRTDSTEDLVKAGVFSRAELARFVKSEDFLWAVRCHLHFLTGRAEERLSFDLQREMAVRLGYTAHPGLRDVERFMKHYFLVAKEVGDLTRIFCSALEEHHGKPRAGAEPFLRLRPPPSPPQDSRLDRFRRRQQPHQHRRRRGLRPRPGQPDPHLPFRRPLRPRLPPRGAADDRPLASPDRRGAARGPGSEPALRRDPLLAQPAGSRAPLDERDRPPRQVHPRFRQASSR